MHAMALAPGSNRLVPVERPTPAPGPGEVLVRVAACGVCPTDLHVVDRELPAVPDGIVPGHEIVGRVEALSPGVAGLAPGARVGVPWQCRAGRENLCDAPVFTG
jgi:propanol-preferring alcohol dehydrogenase